MLLSAVNIHKKYKQADHELHILKGIDLGIEEGDVTSIIGPSGAGKSTLLHILGGLDRPSDGKVLLEDLDLYQLSDARRAQARNRQIGFVFQFYHLLPELTALENVILPKMVKNNSKKIPQVEEEGLELLKTVGLKERATHRPSELSGGEQQRVAIARALMNKPDVVLCDEPTGNLDSKNGAAIIEILLSLNARNKQTLVIVTHDEQIAKRSKKVIYIKDGKLE